MTCTKEFLPFPDTNDEELIQTTIGKWIKFTHIDNVPQSVKENFIHKITSETNTSKYFTIFQVLGITESRLKEANPLAILYYQDLLMNIHLQNQPMEALCFTLKMV